MLDWPAPVDAWAVAQATFDEVNALVITPAPSVTAVTAEGLEASVTRAG
jgi:hypothetical protein